MKTVEAQTYVEVTCSCPECNAYLDIFDLGQTKEVMGYDLRAEKCDMEITCPECGKQFIVSDIHY